MHIRYAKEADREFWFALDKHLPEKEFYNKVREQRGYVLSEGGRPVGLLRYQMFWDNTPFCTMLVIEPSFRGRGGGRLLMEHWEHDMRAQGYGMVMTSTQVDEGAQHFYRKLGYKDSGGFVIDISGYAQPMELIMIKAIEPANT